MRTPRLSTANAKKTTTALDAILLPNRSSIKEPTIHEQIEQNKVSLETQLRLTSLDGTFPELPNSLFRLSHITDLELSGLNVKTKLDKLSKLPLLKKLYITGCLTSGFPVELVEIPQIESLSIASGTITELPSQLNNWPSLTYLGLGGCDYISSIKGIPQNLSYLYITGISFEKIPDIIFTLKHIKKLVIGNFSTLTLPPSISKLQTLESLFINYCDLSDLPAELGYLTNLIELWLNDNKIQHLPSVISNLKSLVTLSLNFNILSSLPASMSKLRNLRHLELAANNFQEIPEVVFELTNLEELNLAHRPYIEGSTRNNVRYISDKLLNLKSLKKIDLSENDINNIPTSIIAQGVDAIKSYLRQLQKADKDYLFEAKLLILGEPGAGKTTLTRKLLNPNCTLPTEEESTLGVDVSQYYFPIDATDFPDAIKPGQDRKFRLNIWDFGGQEIYKATHRFFLSDRAVYLLVADSRQEDTDFAYWLHIEEIFGGKSPLLIIINERNGRRRDVDEPELKGHFANIKDILFVDLNEKNKQRLTSIKALVRSLAVRLPHIGSPVPANWTIIRDVLEADSRNQIDVEEYIALCKANGIIDIKDALILSKYFHDIGVFLHFQDDELLDRKIFLKPTWATNAVYKVLDHPLLLEHNGRFSRQEAVKIWHESQFAQVRDELLKLMQKFFLTYKISDAEGYIVPEKLPSNRPSYNWDETNNLVLEYKYEYFMPKGLLTQFIVQKHRYITNHDLVWRRGVLLKRHEAIAEVTETYGSRTIRVRITGKRKRDFMTIIMEALDQINQQYANLVVEKFIPCNCEQCVSAKTPTYYEFSDLQTRLERNQQTIECRKSYKHINVHELIDVLVNPTMLVANKHSELAAMLQIKSAENARAVGPGKIFISYSHKDDRYLKRLLTHFNVLQHEGVEVDAWSDKRLVAGMRWRDEIERAMQECQIAILLVSTDFLASNFIREEELPSILKAAQARGVTVLSVIVAPSRFSATEFLKDYQAINSPGTPLSGLRPAQRDEVYMAVVSRVEQLLLPTG